MSEIKREDEIPRRARVDLWCDAEKVIQAAVDAVEAMPADIRLTDAVNHLWEARQSVADYVDGIPRRVPAVVQERDTLARRVEELEAIASELKCRGCGGLGTVGDYCQREIAPHIFAGEVVDRTCPDCGGTGRWRVPTEGQSAPPVRD